MRAKKIRVVGKLAAAAAFAVLLAGCGPPGPRALLDGRKLLDQGRYPQAVAQLEYATSLLKSNAQAWNYLGLAYHRAGQPTNAVAAYHHALQFDRNLAEAHFNLGCLWLEQKKFDAAKEQFTTYTMQRSQSVGGFLKLGEAHYHARESAPSEEAFQKALRLSPTNPAPSSVAALQKAEALNGLGLVQLQRNRPRDAAQRFSEALKLDPNYRPALLNLATVSHRYLNDTAGALQKYNEYLALKPRPADWEAVNAVVKMLEQPPAPLTRPTTAAAPAAPAANTNAPKPVAHASPPPKIEPAPPLVKTSAASATTATVVKLPPEPIIKTVPDASSATAAPPAVAVAAKTGSAAEPDVTNAPPPAKRSFWSRLNPFRRKTAKPPTAPTPLPPTADAPSPALPSPPPTTSPESSSQSFERYTYLSPAKPTAGDRTAAERAYAQGAQAQRANRLADAAAAYAQAGGVDPSYFEAYFNLGLVAYELRNYRSSLAAWETALAIRPESTDARYNFALALKAAKFQVDAANELEKLLAAAPNETRAHLVLGILYAEPLRQPAKARLHYQRVLELDPRHPQAAVIRYWLTANPK